MIFITVSFLIIWAICYALHIYSEYLDYDYPGIEYARHKKKAIKLYGTANRKELLGLKNSTH